MLRGDGDVELRVFEGEGGLIRAFPLCSAGSFEGAPSLLSYRYTSPKFLHGGSATVRT